MRISCARSFRGRLGAPDPRTACGARAYEQTPSGHTKIQQSAWRVGLFKSILVFENYLLDTALRAQEANGQPAFRIHWPDQIFP